MRLIDLTMPIWPGAGYGEILPFTNTPVEFTEYVDYPEERPAPDPDEIER